MKLYFSPGACSLAPHIVSRELGLTLDLERVNLMSKRCAGGADFATINPKGSVPALVLDDGELLTEGPVISQYLADITADQTLLPPIGKIERYRVLSWLGFINSDIHKSYSPLFRPDTDARVRDQRREHLRGCYDLVERQLETQPCLGGQHFSIADAYLFVVTQWAPMVELDLRSLSALQAFQRRTASRPAVIEAMRREGLLADSVKVPPATEICAVDAPPPAPREAPIA